MLTLSPSPLSCSDRDSMSQVRVPIAGLLALMQQLVAEKTSWATVCQRYVLVSSAEEAEAEEGAKAASNSTAPAATAATAPVVVEYTTRGSFSRPNIVKK